MAFGLAALFSISTVLVPALSSLGGYGWLIGAALGGVFYRVLMPGKQAVTKLQTQG